MKNPYRSLLERPLRTVIFTTLLILLMAKLVPGYEALYDRSIPRSDANVLGVVGFGLALTCLLDMAIAYYVTWGWYDLVDRRWLIFLTPAVNAMAAAGAAMFFGWGAVARAASGGEGWEFVGPMTVAAVALLVQMVASGMLYYRLGKD